MKKIFLTLILFVFSCVCNIAQAAEYAFSAIDSYNQGLQQYKAKSYNSAIASFKKAISIEPTFVDAYYNIASVYVCTKQYDKAIDAYSQVLKINPNDFDAIFELAQICFNRGTYSTAIKYLSYIPNSYYRNAEVEKMKNDSKSLMAISQQKYVRAKINSSNPNKKIILDKFSSPTGIASDSKGNVFVACYSDNSIMKVETNRKTTIFSRSPLLKGPIGVAIDNFDNIYIANYEGDNILKINPQGKVYVFMDKIYKPYYLYIKNDVLFISEQANNIVIKYNLK